MLDVQTVVIGAGVVGLAVARALAQSGREVLVLERAAHVGTETSSRNSEVVHSGIYYPRGSLKARLCVDGREALYAYCTARGVPARRLGKLIVATGPAEVGVLERYRALALAHGAGEFAVLTADEVSALEPEVRCAAALHVTATGIVDSHALMTALWGDLEAAGGQVVFDADVCSGERVADGRMRLSVEGCEEPVACRELVNAAGLHAPVLARQLQGSGAEAAPRSYYARGHYYGLAGRSPFSRLVYPVAESGGLGVHVTLDLAGRARFGPDVEWVAAPDYAFDDTRRARFADAIRRYYPALDDTRLQPDYVGVRPKISGPGDPAADFRIDGPRSHGVPGVVHLYGIESPGLTACLAIADHVVGELAASAGEVRTVTPFCDRRAT